MVQVHRYLPLVRKEPGETEVSMRPSHHCPGSEVQVCRSKHNLKPTRSGPTAIHFHNSLPTFMVFITIAIIYLMFFFPYQTVGSLRIGSTVSLSLLSHAFLLRPSPIPLECAFYSNSGPLSRAAFCLVLLPSLWGVLFFLINCLKTNKQTKNRQQCFLTHGCIPKHSLAPGTQ